MLWRLLFVFIFAAYTDAADVVRCFECTDISHPGDCDTVTSCTVGQICVVEQYITSGGLTLYNTGCQSRQKCTGSHRRDIPEYSSLSKRANIITCDECCDGEFCNNKGCGNIAPAQSRGAVTCFACDAESSTRGCIHIKTCDTGLVCMLRELAKRGPSGEPLYNSDCVSPKVCQTFALLGRKRYTYCHVCCSDDFCNDRCDATITQAPTTPSLPLSTTSKTTTSTTTTTSSTTTTPKPPPSTATTPTTPTTTTTTPKSTTMSTTTTTTPKPTLTTTQTPPTTTMTSTSQQHLHDVCIDHHYTYDSHSNLCYKLHYEHESSWNEANQVCEQEGGTLAKINTQTKWDFLKNVLRNEPKLKNSHRIYIGGRHTHDDVFQWVGGESVVFADWGQHQPRGQPNSCVFMHEMHHFQWYDTIDCQQTHHFVCSIQ